MPSETDFWNDVAAQFSANPADAGSQTSGKAGTAEGATNFEMRGNGQIAKTYLEGMIATHKDGTRRANIMGVIKSFVAEVLKLGTTDISSLFTTSISSRQSFLRNPETPLLNLIEMAPGEQFVVDDWLYRITERRRGADLASQVNPEDNISTVLHQTVYSEKYNVLAFWGDPVSVTFIARAQAGQQNPTIDLLRREMDDEVRAIRRRKNFDYWNSVLQANFTPPNVTTVGGIISRILTNNLACGGMDLSEALLEAAILLIADQIGYSGQKLLFTDSTQVGSVRLIEINRYGGNNPVAFEQYNQMLAADFAKYKMLIDRIFEPNIGPVIPVCHDRQMPNNQSVLMSIDPDYCVKEAKFKIGDEFGPWMFVRPVYNLNETVFVMDGATLDDPAEETKVLLDNHKV